MTLCIGSLFGYLPAALHGAFCSSTTATQTAKQCTLSACLAPNVSLRTPSCHCHTGAGPARACTRHPSCPLGVCVCVCVCVCVEMGGGVVWGELILLFVPPLSPLGRHPFPVVIICTVPPHAAPWRPPAHVCTASSPPHAYGDSLATEETVCVS